MPDEETPVRLDSFGADLNVAVLGASGGVGGALADELERVPAVRAVFRLARTPPAPTRDRWLPIDLEDEPSIAAAARAVAAEAGRLHLVLVATGVLHDGARLQPEKSWKALSARSLERAFRINAIGPALAAKHFLPLLAEEPKSAFAALSARVGSITDNRLGGWHAYRSSKAALNMLVKTLALELARRNPRALCVGLHPGTVDTALSKPFQRGVAGDALFTPRHAARRLLSVLDGLATEDSGGVFAWDGVRVPP